MTEVCHSTLRRSRRPVQRSSARLYAIAHLAKKRTLSIVPRVPTLDTVPDDLKELLGKRISELGLILDESPVASCVQQLYRELERKGLHKFRPPCYLSDEWGCPDLEPVIGIPFYLAEPRLAQIEKHLNDLENERQVMMYLRHEAGHAINYAYRLFRTPEWRELFGPFHRAYRDRYRPVPFSRKYVRHIEGWYAQKHPDEDFAETFAVWLTPGSNWRRAYRTWPAIRKLRYVDRVCRAIGDRDPVVPTGTFDLTVTEMKLTVGEFYRRTLQQDGATVNVSLDADLAGFFPKPRRRRNQQLRPAAEVVEELRPTLTDRITYWSGVKRAVVRALIERMVRSCGDLGLVAEAGREQQYAVELTTYATVLAMNYLTRGKFFHG